jgi:hypothetical protein
MIDHLNSKSFSDQLHTTFQVHVPEIGKLPLELIEVMEYTDQPKVEQFCLIFRGPRDPWFPQKIYTLEHEALGKMDLFIAPLGPDEKGMRYQVIFNRFRK